MLKNNPYRGVPPVTSLLLEIEDQRRAYRRHIDALCESTPCIDTTAPPLCRRLTAYQERKKYIKSKINDLNKEKELLFTGHVLPPKTARRREKAMKMTDKEMAKSHFTSWVESYNKQENEILRTTRQYTNDGMTVVDTLKESPGICSARSSTSVRKNKDGNTCKSADLLLPYQKQNIEVKKKKRPGDFEHNCASGQTGYKKTGEGTQSKGDRFGRFDTRTPRRNEKGVSNENSNHYGNIKCKNLVKDSHSNAHYDLLSSTALNEGEIDTRNSKTIASPFSQKGCSELQTTAEGTPKNVNKSHGNILTARSSSPRSFDNGRYVHEQTSINSRNFDISPVKDSSKIQNRERTQPVFATAPVSQDMVIFPGKAIQNSNTWNAGSEINIKTQRHTSHAREMDYRYSSSPQRINDDYSDFGGATKKSPKDRESIYARSLSSSLNSPFRSIKVNVFNSTYQAGEFSRSPGQSSFNRSITNSDAQNLSVRSLNSDEKDMFSDF